jgi:hypothetical protein
VILYDSTQPVQGDTRTDRGIPECVAEFLSCPDGGRLLRTTREILGG